MRANDSPPRKTLDSRFPDEDPNVGSFSLQYTHSFPESGSEKHFHGSAMRAINSSYRKLWYNPIDPLPCPLPPLPLLTGFVIKTIIVKNRSIQQVCSSILLYALNSIVVYFKIKCSNKRFEIIEKIDATQSL
jgi:hypothetical protein